LVQANPAVAILARRHREIIAEDFADKTAATSEDSGR